MNSTDYKAYEYIFPLWIRNTKVPAERVCLLSPWPEQTALLHKLFPKGKIVVTTRETWNLDTPCPFGKFDLAVAMNVFSYAKDPGLWFKNIRAAAKDLWIQDHVSRKRSHKEGCELGNDGECMRYTFEPYATALLPGAYNLAKQPVIAFYAYDDPEAHNGFPAVSFLARISGEA